MLLDEAITERILEAWRADEENPLRSRDRRELPPVTAVRQFVDESFLATLRDEEGRPVSYSATLLTVAQLADAVGRSPGSYLALSVPIEYTAATIAKIAPALDPRLASLVVLWETAGEPLSCRGFWLHGPSENRFTEIPVSMAGSRFARLDFLTLVSKGRGSLVVARSNSLIGAVRGSDFMPATATPFTSHSLGVHLMRLLQTDADVNFWHVARDALEVLLSEAALRGHGSTIVILPRGAVRAAAAHYHPKYSFAEPFGIERILRDCVEPSVRVGEPDANALMAGALVRAAYRRLAYEMLQGIGQLAAVDGALVMDSGFAVLAFGTTLSAPDTASGAVAGPDGFGRAEGGSFEIGRYGTRHSSAMHFAAAVPDSIVFVISQDGPVRAFRRRDEETVEVWPDCRTSMFI